MTVRAVRMDPKDNVAIVTTDATPGDPVDAGDATVTAGEPVPRGQKIALSAISTGQPVFRYGEEIGVALTDIAPGQHVHTHNLGGRR